MLWLKAFHVAMVVSWFAGLFYLPRLFVNHAECPDGPVHERLSLMERKLYRFVTPIMMLAVLSGMGLAWMLWDIVRDEAWFWTKAAIVGGLVAYHAYCGVLQRRFAAGENTRSHVFYRWFNELPVLALFAIVVLVIVRPF